MECLRSFEKHDLLTPLDYNTLRITLPEKRMKDGTTKQQIMEDHSPYVFMKIRELSGISNEEYLQSLGIVQMFAQFLCGKLTTFSMKVSEGRSGSLFFTSCDGRYMVKTIPVREKNSLLLILKAYYYVLFSFSYFFSFLFHLFLISLLNYYYYYYYYLNFIKIII